MSQVELKRRRAAANQVHDALGVRLFKPVPEGFDPLQASARALLAHGFPARPDARRHPELHATWERMVSRPMLRIEPQFALRTDKRHGIRHAIANDTSTNWSGAVSFAAAGDSVTYVIGQWTVPDVAAPGTGAFNCSTWIGIDGDGSPDVLQAGTEQEIVSLGFITVHQTYAWWEWFPDYEVQIANFPVSPGDVMFCAICVHSSTEAGFYLTNVTTGLSTSFTKTAPGGTTLVGNCAEWIVETPTVNGKLAALPRYGDVYFDSCVAGTSRHALLEGGSGTPITMLSSSNKQISIPTLETSQLVKVAYSSGS